MEDTRSDAVTSTGRVSPAVYSATTSTTAALVPALVLIALASAVLRESLTLVAFAPVVVVVKVAPVVSVLPIVVPVVVVPVSPTVVPVVVVPVVPIVVTIVVVPVVPIIVPTVPGAVTVVPVVSSVVRGPSPGHAHPVQSQECWSERNLQEKLNKFHATSQFTIPKAV
jgi:hypothetical protein